jgi:YfiH family protein
MTPPASGAAEAEVPGLPADTARRAVDELAGISGLIAGITIRTADGGRGRADDFGLATGGAAWEVTERYEALAHDLDLSSASVCRQVHGTAYERAGFAPDRGVWIAGAADGFVGRAAGRLFVVTVADCVPVYVVDPDSRAFALLHAGWRGAAAGILGRAVRTLAEEYDARTHDLHVHLGPAICGPCYEVGPEVPAAFGVEVTGTSQFDVRAALADEARRLGVHEDRITLSTLCTRCPPGSLLHSHRGGGPRAGRMAGYLGWEP